MKERLTGAIILVALIVFLVPELLKGPIHSAPRAVDSSAEGPPLRSYTINLGEDSRLKGAAVLPASGPPTPTPLPQSDPAPPPQDPTPAPAQAQDNPPPAAPVITPTPRRPGPAARGESQQRESPATPTVTEGSGAFMVQLGSFASRANAEHLAQKLKSQGFAASVSRSSTGRHLYRVRVGPVRDKSAAAQLLAKLHAGGHTGSVVPK